MSDSVRPHRRQHTRLPVRGILQARVLEWGAIAFSVCSMKRVKKVTRFHELIGGSWGYQPMKDGNVSSNIEIQP